MSAGHHDRLLFNELSTLLERISPTAILELKDAYPEYADEIVKGPDAGANEHEISYELARAKFTLVLTEKAVVAIDKLAEKIISRSKSLHTGKLTVAIIGGLGGAVTLGSLGLDKDDVSRISGIVTAVIAILNGVFEQYSKRYSAAEIQKTIDLRKAAYDLAIKKNKLESQIAANLDISEIAKSVEECNGLASELNNKGDFLRTI